MNLENSLIEHCSPTLAGLKTASLFTTKFFSQSLLEAELKKLNFGLKSKGIKILILKMCENTALIYVYREQMLKLDISNELTQTIFNRYGYFGKTVDEMLTFLSARLNSYYEFPHEIGLFLGYPPEDVEGFICNKGKDCRLCGYWKVYGNKEEAVQKFAKYDKCKAVYKRLWNEGTDIERLTVFKQSKVA